MVKIKKILLGISLGLISNISFAQCYIMGDSIAQGVAQNMRVCSSATKVGLNTNQAKQYWVDNNILHKQPVQDLTVISLGVNDGNAQTLENLVKIRANLKSKRIVWILPPKKQKSDIVERIANHYNDYMLEINPVLGKDGIHPTGQGYQAIAQKIKKFHIK